jgi:hypothetical protein
MFSEWCGHCRSRWDCSYAEDEPQEGVVHAGCLSNSNEYFDWLLAGRPDRPHLRRVIRTEQRK